jgi:hypothetical protein
MDYAYPSHCIRSSKAAQLQTFKKKIEKETIEAEKDLKNGSSLFHAGNL